ncbi:hypothetical protein [Bradyrhizobium elkanii]|uniref:hypothetical protein n=1 Tax=Bradyrhizobium elkanii TaxID=29448 RepID=UPI0004B0DCDE|nr:hypothetical protein [Bradyrhizobium elkanii]WLA79597.1 hypothetical protein QNJ99_29900 [Bradyrhizobium elkanii]
MKPIKQTWLEAVRADERRKAATLAEARRVWDATDVEARDRGRLEHALLLWRLADRRLKEAEELWRRQKEREYVADLRRRARAPPDLQALVLAHGTYDRITPEAWAAFDRDMEGWKLRIQSSDEFLEEQNALRQAEEAGLHREAVGRRAA